MGIQCNCYSEKFIRLDDIDGFLATMDLPGFSDENGWETAWDSQERKHCYEFGIEKIYIYDLEYSDVLRVKIW